jgi:phage terminase large subunit
VEKTDSFEVLIPEEFKEGFNPKWRNILFYGGRGSTKSHSVARILLLKARASKRRQLCAREFQNSIEESSYQLMIDLISQYEMTDFTYTKTEIINTVTGSNMIFKGLKKGTSQSIKSLEGIDDVWVEEAQSVSEESLKILSPTVRNKGSQLYFTYNRVTELDPVHVKYILNPPPDTYSKQVNYDAAIRAGFFPDVLRVEMEHDKATDYDNYAHVWLGEPMGQGDNAIIPRSAALQSMERKVEDDGAIIIGADIARMGTDRIVFWMRKGFKTVKTASYTKLRINETCDKLEQFVIEFVRSLPESKDLKESQIIEFAKSLEIRIDDTGVGGGVTDDMMNRSYKNIKAVNFGAKAIDGDKYPNWISEAWFNMAEIIKEIELPMISDLLMELTTRQWKMDSKGKRRVESKDDYKKRGFRSPDLADAAIICFARAVDDRRIQVIAGLNDRPNRTSRYSRGI